MESQLITRTFSTGGTDRTEESETHIWLHDYLLQHGAPREEVDLYYSKLALNSSEKQIAKVVQHLRAYAIEKGYLTEREVEVVEQLSGDLSRVLSNYSEADRFYPGYGWGSAGCETVAALGDDVAALFGGEIPAVGESFERAQYDFLVSIGFPKDMDELALHDYIVMPATFWKGGGYTPYFVVKDTSGVQKSHILHHHSDLTIGGIKLALWNQERIPVSAQKIVYAGRELADSRATIADEGVDVKATIFLVRSQPSRGVVQYGTSI